MSEKLTDRYTFYRKGRTRLIHFGYKDSGQTVCGQTVAGSKLAPVPKTTLNDRLCRNCVNAMLKQAVDAIPAAKE